MGTDNNMADNTDMAVAGIRHCQLHHQVSPQEMDQVQKTAVCRHPNNFSHETFRQPPYKWFKAWLLLHLSIRITTRFTILYAFLRNLAWAFMLETGKNRSETQHSLTYD